MHGFSDHGNWQLHLIVAERGRVSGTGGSLDGHGYTIENPHRLR